MEWKATTVTLEDELVLKTKSLLTSAHLNVILVFSLSPWVTMNEIELTKLERRTCRTEGLICYFSSLFPIPVFSGQNSDDSVHSGYFSPIFGHVIYIRKQTMVCSELIVLPPIFSEQKHGFHSKRPFSVLS